MEMKVMKSKTGSKILIPKEINGYPVIEQEILTDTDRFTMVHNRIIDTKLLTVKEKTLYMVLKSFCYDTDVCIPSEKYLAYLSGCDEKTVRAYVRKLEKYNLICSVTLRSKGEIKTRKYYKMLPSSEWLLEPDNEIRAEWLKLSEEYEIVDEEKTGL